MNCLTTFSLLLIAVPQFASITEERITVKRGEDVELLCINSRSQDEVVWVTPDICKDDDVYIEKNLTPCTRRFHTFHKGLSGNQAEMVLKNVHPLDSGYYVCEHWLLDAEYRKIYIKVLDDRSGVEMSTLSIVLAIVMLACLSAFLLIFLAVKMKRTRAGNFVNSAAVSEVNIAVPSNV